MPPPKNLAPRSAELCKTGIHAFKQGQLDVAEQHLRSAMQISPDSALPQCYLATILQVKGKTAEASELYERAIMIDPEYAEPYSNLGVILQADGRHADAIEKFRDALKRDPHKPGYYVNLGISLRALKKYDQAIDAFNSALAIQPNDARILRNLSQTHKKKKDSEQALHFAKKCVATNPGNCQAHKDLCHLSGYEPTASHIDLMLKLHGRPEIVGVQRILLSFALGRALKCTGDFKDSARFFDEANLLGSRQVGPIIHQTDLYDPAKLKRMETLEYSKTTSGSSAIKPIFIIGLPRSGKSSLEFILGQSPKVAEAGEVGFSLNWTNFRSDVSTAIERAHAASIKYRQVMTEFYPNTEYVTDTMGFNLVSLGIIKKLIPESRFIFCVRDPLENAIAVYHKYLKKKLHRYSFSLKEIAAHFNMFSSYMQYWINRLGDDCAVIDFDKVKTDPMAETQKAFKACGIEFEEQYTPEFISSAQTPRLSSGRVTITMDPYLLSEAYPETATEVEKHLSVFSS